MRAGRQAHIHAPLRQGLLKIAVPNFIVWILGFYR